MAESESTPDALVGPSPEVLHHLSVLSQEWGWGPIGQVTRMQGGWSNLNYRVEREHAPPLLLKIWQSCTTQEATTMAQLGRGLAELGFPTPAPLAGPSGALIHPGPAGDWMLVPFLPGQTLERSPAALESLGELLGRLHGLTPPVVLPQGVRIGLPWMHSLLVGPQVLPDWFAAVLRRWLPELRERIPDTLPRGLIHADPFPDNVLAQGAQIVALLDFESSCRDWLALDLAMAALGSIWEDTEPVPERLSALIHGYSTRRTPSAAELDALPALHSCAALGFASWHVQKAVRLGGDTRSERRARYLVSLLEAKLPI